MTVGELLEALAKVDRHLPVTVQIPCDRGEDAPTYRLPSWAESVGETSFPGVGRLLVIGLER